MPPPPPSSRKPKPQGRDQGAGSEKEAAAPEAKKKEETKAAGKHDHKKVTKKGTKAEAKSEAKADATPAPTKVAEAKTDAKPVEGQEGRTGQRGRNPKAGKPRRPPNRPAAAQRRIGRTPASKSRPDRGAHEAPFVLTDKKGGRSPFPPRRPDYLGKTEEVIDGGLDLAVGKIAGAALGGMAPCADGVLVQAFCLGQARRPGGLCRRPWGTGGAGIVAGAANGVEDGGAVLGRCRPRGRLCRTNLATGWMRTSAPSVSPDVAADLSPLMEKGTTTAIRTTAATMVPTMIDLEECCWVMFVLERGFNKACDYNGLPVAPHGRHGPGRQNRYPCGLPTDGPAVGNVAAGGAAKPKLASHHLASARP